MPDSSAALLSGRVVLVTGASSGIGRAIAIAAARAGADVAVTFRSNADGVRETESQIRALGRRVETFQVDISNEADLARLGPAVRGGLGRLDAWINNAGADILTGACRLVVRRREARPAALGGSAGHHAGVLAGR